VQRLAGAGEVSVQPSNVSCTVNVPEALTVIDCVVAPLDQRYDCAGLAVSVTLPPWQKVVGPSAVIAAAACVTVFEAVSVQPSCVTCTEYVPGLETLIEGVVAPVDQRYDEPPAAVRVVEPPGQNAAEPEIVATGIGLMFTVAESVQTQPLAFVAVSV
jgi:hypothetical protein